MKRIAPRETTRSAAQRHRRRRHGGPERDGAECQLPAADHKRHAEQRDPMCAFVQNELSACFFVAQRLMQHARSVQLCAARR